MAVPFDLTPTMTEQMDVDVPTSFAACMITSSESLSTASSLEKLDPELHLEPLNDKMRDRCRSEFWRVRLEATEDDHTLWHPLISSVLMYLTRALAATDAKSSFIAAQNSTDAEAIVQGFNKKELGEWKVGVRRGVETNDWTSLITHRTYISDYQMLGSSDLWDSEASEPKPLPEGICLHDRDTVSPRVLSTF